MSLPGQRRGDMLSVQLGCILTLNPEQAFSGCAREG